ncbi:MAG: glycoside hydrolase family 2 protein [Ignavibacteriales bacterium]|nr:glycoside hydrolase family 2 protein [Ignavibacteriales bacterium]
MKKIDLNGLWRFKAMNKYRTLPANKRDVMRWMTATVPGTVHTDLLANEKIADPFYRMNELDVQWVDSQQWLYRREFEVTEDVLKENKIELVAEGLDTYAEIRCNGTLVGSTANMFVEHRLNIKKALRLGRNVLEIVFDSPVVRSKELQRQHGALQVALEPHRVYVRKAQYSFSWDWGPKLTTSGIWRSISLEAYSHPRLVNPFIKVLSINKREAVVLVSVDIENMSQGPIQLTTIISGDGCDIKRRQTIRKNRIVFRLHIANPNLWWPNGYGKQPMYKALLTLEDSTDSVSSVVVPFALRTVKLVQERDDEGKSFIIEINGTHIFCKGADWIPSDNFVPRIPSTTYERLLTMAKDAHMNMIRVWGGGIYEQNVFYELCDRLGLMVWQDFMFACGEYPEQQWFLQQVQDEATKVVKRLRNHPSIVLWCGNNECEWLFCVENPTKTPNDMNGAPIFRDILPAICKEFDGTRPYWRSSPFGNGFPNDESNGNHHQWQVWSAWKDFKDYEGVNARFVTEFGFQAPAHRATFEKITHPTDRQVQSPVMEHHNKQIEGNERLFRFQSAHYIVEKDFNDFIYKGQLVQAEALKTAVEHWRRRKFKTAGAIFWQLNDCWPVSSWSVVDSALRPKAAYYYAKRFFAPLLVSFKKSNDTIEVWGTNDTLSRIDVTVVLALQSFDGKKVWSKQVHNSLARNSSARIFQMKVPDADPAGGYLLAQMKTGETIASENRFFFVEPKHFRLPKPEIHATLSQVAGNQATLTIQSKQFLKNVSVEFDELDVVLDDNYFDMDARGSKHLVFISEHRLADLKRKLTIRHL